VSAPSGAGKTSICKEVLKMLPRLRYSVSYTTRPQRPGEVNGRDYVFVSERTFRRMIEKEAFIEWAENYGHLYGTPRKYVENYLRKGYDVIFDVDPRGAKALMQGRKVVFVLDLASGNGEATAWGCDLTEKYVEINGRYTT